MAGPVTTEPMPLILTDASITIDGNELACVANHVEISPDTNITTLDTMCGSKDYPGVVKWHLVATLYQSFDTDATEDTLSAALAAYRATGTLPEVVVTPYKSRPVGPTNPSWTGEVIPMDYSPINGDAGDASSIDLEWSYTAPPVKSTTPLPLASSSSS